VKLEVDEAAHDMGGATSTIPPTGNKTQATASPSWSIPAHYGPDGNDLVPIFWKTKLFLAAPGEEKPSFARFS